MSTQDKSKTLVASKRLKFGTRHAQVCDFFSNEFSKEMYIGKKKNVN